VCLLQATDHPAAWPYKTLESGEKAHLTCYLEHMDEEENELGR